MTKLPTVSHHYFPLISIEVIVVTGQRPQIPYLTRALHVHLRPVRFARRRRVGARGRLRLNTGIPEVGVLQVQRVGRLERSSHDAALYRHVVGLFRVRSHDHFPREHLALFHHERLGEQTPHLVPMGQRLGGRGREPDAGARSVEGHVEPEGEAVDGAALRDVVLQRDLHLVQVLLGGREKVDGVLLSLGEADTDVERVDDGLTEVLGERGVPQRRQVDAVEVVLVPEVDLVDLLHVEGFVGEGSHVEVAACGEHFAAGFEPFLRVQERPDLVKFVTEIGRIRMESGDVNA